MRSLLAGLTLLAAVATAWAGSPLVGELQAFSTRYHENPRKIDQLKAALEKAAETEPDSDTLLALAQFWYGTNTGRWGQTKGIMRSLFLLPTVKEAMQTALALDPGYAPAYALGGSIYYEVPGYAGGDLDRSEAMFRKGLELAPRDTNMRLGLARTLLKKGRTADARRELEAVLGEKAPSNPADWTIKDVPEAKAILVEIKGRS